jgi:hypothetical protein
MSSIKTMEQPITQVMDFDSTESPTFDTVSNDLASVASHKSADANISAPVEAPNTNPWIFDHTESGQFEIQDKNFPAFNLAVEGFCRDLLAERSYHHVTYAAITFRTLESMVKFFGSLRKMRTAISNKGRGDAGPFGYLSFFGNSAIIWDSTWPSSELKATLKEMHISCKVNVVHQVVIKFASEKEERHFASDCDLHGVKWGVAKCLAPAFQLPSFAPVDPATSEAVYLLDEDTEEWTARKKYDGYEFELGPFNDREGAAKACSQFDFLVSLIPHSVK